MSFLIIAVIIIIALAMLAALKAKQPSKDAGLTFEDRGTLFTPAERSFFGILEQTLGCRYRVFGKVRLGDIIKPARGLSNSKRTTALNMINQKYLDFVVCSASDLAVVGVVELDDQSHRREDRAARDEFVDQALASAKIPVARFSAKKGYALQEVRTKMVEVFRLAVESSQSIVTEEQPSPLQLEPMTASGEIPPEEVSPVCPKCAATMVKRQAKNGPHAGKWFWACATFPKCRQVVEL